MARRKPRSEPTLPFPDLFPDGPGFDAPTEAIDLSANALLAHVSDLVAVVDHEGRLRAVSPSVEARLGHRVGRLLGAPVSALFVADPADVPNEVLNRVFAEPGSHGPFILMAMTADGRSRPVEAIIENQLTWEGVEDEPRGSIVVTAVDLTERKMRDSALAEQRSLLEDIARGVELDEVVDRIVDRIERWIPDAVAAVLVVGDETNGQRRGWRVAAAPSVPEVVVEVFDQADGDSPVARALGELPDTTSAVSVLDPAWFPLRAACREAGVETCWIRPFRMPDRDEPVGAIMVVRTDERPLDQAELDLIEQSSHLAAIAVERRHATAALEHRALHDDLTGLPNRTLLLDRVALALHRSKRESSGVAVLFVDLDRFKHINDTLGHSAGDAVLCEVSRRLQDVLRADDTVGRLGGDEFVMVCSDIAGPLEAMTVARRVWESLDDPIVFGREELRVRASVGVALADGAELLGDSPHEVDLNATHARRHPHHEVAAAVIRDADLAMYRAKERGRNGIALFDRDDHKRVVSRVDIEQGLHGAHERGELVLHFQPIVSLPDGRQNGVEALVRWERPGVGLVQPDEFIAIAEDTGQIVPLGAWVIEEAIRSAAAWPDIDAHRRMRVSINLSPRQVATPGLIDRVRRLLDRTGVDPSLICFEVTEIALARDEELAITTLHRLKGLGVRLAIDDFGTGYATLDHLRRFSMADTLKIDRSFTAGLGDPLSQEHAIVAATVNLAHSLDIEVIAEGVETGAQLAAAIDLGCDHAQGYLLGRPQHFVAAAAAPATSASLLPGTPTPGRDKPGL